MYRCTYPNVHVHVFLTNVRTANVNSAGREKSPFDISLRAIDPIPSSPWMLGKVFSLKRHHQKIHSRKLTWKPKKGSTKTTVCLKGDYMGFHVSLGECALHACRGLDQGTPADAHHNVATLGDHPRGHSNRPRTQAEQNQRLHAWPPDEGHNLGFIFFA